jgi:hypothetical protein
VRFLLTFQEVMPISKTRNQLLCQSKPARPAQTGRAPSICTTPPPPVSGAVRARRCARAGAPASGLLAGSGHTRRPGTAAGAGHGLRLRCTGVWAGCPAGGYRARRAQRCCRSSPPASGALVSGDRRWRGMPWGRPRAAGAWRGGRGALSPRAAGPLSSRLGVRPPRSGDGAPPGWAGRSQGIAWRLRRTSGVSRTRSLGPRGSVGVSAGPWAPPPPPGRRRVPRRPASRSRRIGSAAS